MNLYIHFFVCLFLQNHYLQFSCFFPYKTAVYPWRNCLNTLSLFSTSWMSLILDCLDDFNNLTGLFSYLPTEAKCLKSDSQQKRAHTPKFHFGTTETFSGLCSPEDTFTSCRFPVWKMLRNNMGHKSCLFFLPLTCSRVCLCHWRAWHIKKIH